jgi:putative isomerase
MTKMAHKQLCPAILLGLVIAVLPVWRLPAAQKYGSPLTEQDVSLKTGLDTGKGTSAPADVSPSVLMSPAGRALEKRVGPENWQKLLKRVATVNSDIATRGIRSFPGTTDKLLTGYHYNEYYDWDLYFENVYLTYFGVNDYCFTNLKMFLGREQPDGYVNRSLIKQRDRQHFKPFLAQLAVMGTKMRGDDYEWARGEYYDKLKKYLERWFAYDGDHNGLPVWNSADHSGMDNQWSRAGALGSFEIEGVDLACYLVRELRAMAIIADKLGKQDDKKAFLDHATRLGKLINDVFWDEKDGFYYDRNEKKNERVKVKSVAAFMPLWAGVATPRRARRIVKEHLLNEKEFWLKYPVATYAKTEPDYYQGSHNECNWRGSTWMPTNYMIFHGLVHYGFKGVAGELADRTFRMVIEENPVTREYYNAETGAGIGQKEFWGFSILGYVMPLELELGYDPTDLDAPVKPVVTQHLGLQFPASAPSK